eukprot:Clim_evm15s150 gene=Clim_evmTU15s150
MGKKLRRKFAKSLHGPGAKKAAVTAQERNERKNRQKREKRMRARNRATDLDENDSEDDFGVDRSRDADENFVKMALNELHGRTGKKQVSRKGKKAWRKNIDVDDARDYLASKNKEYAQGGALEDMTAEDLVYDDRGAEEDELPEKPMTKKQRRMMMKPMKSWSALETNPLVKPVSSKIRSEKGTSATRAESLRAAKERDVRMRMPAKIRDEYSKKEMQKLRKDVDVLKRQMEEMKDKGTLRGTLNTSKAEIDIWDSDEFLNAVAKQIPKTVMEARKKDRGRNVDVAPAGASYNPTFEDHQELLMKAARQELLRLKKEAETEKALRPQKTPIVTLAERDQEMMQGLGHLVKNGTHEEDEDEDESETNSEEASEDNEDDEDGRPQARIIERKTRQQRLRERARRLEELKLKEAKQVRQQEALIFSNAKIRTQIEAEREAIRARKERAKAKKASRKERLSRYKEKEELPDVLLTDELTSSLRGLEPQGNVMKDRFKSLTKRGIIEIRKRVIPHRKYKQKFGKKNAYKEYDRQEATAKKEKEKIMEKMARRAAK